MKTVKHRWLCWLLSGVVAGAWAVPLAWAHQPAQQVPAQLRAVGLDQRLGDAVPLDLQLRDETGARVHLRDYIHDQPVILTLVYTNCPNLCPLVLDGLFRALRAISLTLGEDFRMLTVSIDPHDIPEQAAALQHRYLQRYKRAGAAHGWHVLTGDTDAIQRLTEAVGFRYTYDATQDQYAHASGIMILTPQGVLARYIFGVEYVPRDLRLALVEAAHGSIGTPVDQLLLYCYHYDPQTGKYGLVIMNVVRLAGLLTVLSLGALMGVMLWRERRTGAASTTQKAVD
jgi:protein SCO1/2